MYSNSYFWRRDDSVPPATELLLIDVFHILYVQFFCLTNYQNMVFSETNK